jgi:hypothetical protein
LNAIGQAAIRKKRIFNNVIESLVLPSLPLKPGMLHRQLSIDRLVRIVHDY